MVRNLLTSMPCISISSPLVKKENPGDPCLLISFPVLGVGQPTLGKGRCLLVQVELAQVIHEVGVGPGGQWALEEGCP